MFTKELVLQWRKPTAVGELTHAQGKDSMGVRYAWASWGKKVLDVSGKRKSKARRLSC